MKVNKYAYKLLKWPVPAPMSRIERKYCLISTSCLAGYFDIFIFISDRIVGVLVTFYK